MTFISVNEVRPGQIKTDPGSRIRLISECGIYKEIPFQSFRFTGGEVHVKLSNPPFETKNLFIIANLQTAEDIMVLMLLVDAIRRHYPKTNSLNLHLSYIPYARQDRAAEFGEALSIKVFVNLINSCKFNYVQVEDPHSDVAPALIENCIVKEQWELVMPFLRAADIKNPIFVSPDAGALKKVTKLTKKFGAGADMIRADKTRDTATGKITGTVVYPGSVDITDTSRPLIIVDDICDGGATFVGLAKELKKLTNSKIILYVSSGIFSKGFDELGEVLDQLWVNFSFLTGGDLFHGFKPEDFEVYTPESLPPKFTPPV